MVCLSYKDFRYYKIPVQINCFILILGIAHIAFTDASVLDGMLGFGSVSCVLLMIYLISGGKAIGGGDVKLMAVSGLILGWQRSFLAFFLSGICVILFHPMRRFLFTKDRKLAFGPYLSLGIFISMILGDRIISLYTAWPGI